MNAGKKYQDEINKTREAIMDADGGGSEIVVTLAACIYCSELIDDTSYKCVFCQELWPLVARSKDADGDIAFDNRLDVPALLRKPKKQTQASKQGAANFKAGVTSEKQVRKTFEDELDFFRVTKLKTGYNPYKKYSQPTAADFSAVQCHTGLSALIEAKNITGDRLQHSRVKPHQRAELDKQRQNNALAYLAITTKVRGRWKTAVLDWPVKRIDQNGLTHEFKKGTSVLWAWAWDNRINK